MQLKTFGLKSGRIRLVAPIPHHPVEPLSFGKSTRGFRLRYAQKLLGAALLLNEWRTEGFDLGQSPLAGECDDAKALSESLTPGGYSQNEGGNDDRA